MPYAKHLLLMISAVLLLGCETSPTAVAQASPSPNAPGIIEKFGSKLALCGMLGRGVCEARVFMIGTVPQPFSASSVQVPTGVQAVGVICRFGQVGAPVGIAASFSNFHINVYPGAQYRIEAAYTEIGTCITDIIDVRTGKSAAVSASGV